MKLIPSQYMSIIVSLDAAENLRIVRNDNGIAFSVRIFFQQLHKLRYFLGFKLLIRISIQVQGNIHLFKRKE